MPKKSAKLNGKNGAPPKAAYFLSLTVENVRCFGPAQTLDLSDGNGRPARWTIILGANGTGKTTLLQCLVAMLPRDVESPPIFYLITQGFPPRARNQRYFGYFRLRWVMLQPDSELLAYGINMHGFPIKTLCR